MPFAGRKHHGDCRFGGTIANRTCLCRGAACRSRHNAADTNRLPLKWYAPIVSVRFFGSRYGTAVPSRDCTPRALPRASRSGRHVGLRPPRNDNSGAFAILTVACTDCKCIAGLGCPLPCNAQLVALCHKINAAKIVSLHDGHGPPCRLTQAVEKPAQPEVSEGRKV